MDNAAPGVCETARYKVYLNKSEKNVLILRFPDRTQQQQFNDQNGSKPLSLRIKPKSRLIEVDIPLPDKNHIDKRRAIELGQGTRKHALQTKNAPVGIASGFGQPPPPNKREQMEQPSEGQLMGDFDSAIDSGQALNKITYSGMIKPFSSTDPTYYVGNFQGDELHLTKISAFCTLGVGLQHLDAMDVSEKTARRAANEDEDEKAVSIGMQIKSGDERVTDEGAWKKLLNEVHLEKWQDLEWIDEHADEAYTLFDEAMFLEESSKPNRLLATMSRQQYLDTISAPRIDSMVQARRIRADGSLAEDGDVDLSDASDQEQEDQVMTDVRG